MIGGRAKIPGGSPVFVLTVFVLTVLVLAVFVSMQPDWITPCFRQFGLLQVLRLQILLEGLGPFGKINIGENLWWYYRIP